MDLRERAIKAAKEQQEWMEKNKKEAAEKFAAEAKKKFEKTFNEVVLDVEPISENKAKIIADGLSFIAIKGYTDFVSYIKFYPQIECTQCGNIFTYYDEPCERLADVGFILMKSTICDTCRCENMGSGTKSPAGRVLELLGEILDILEAERGE
ncbi:MAG: hypothetical protein N2V72_00605 [Methanophagales archaeon]|nr:hypothetical protein [Methanophagales archaeon]